jgi:hypothetical protein
LPILIFQGELAAALLAQPKMPHPVGIMNSLAAGAVRVKTKEVSLAIVKSGVAVGICASF